MQLQILSAALAMAASTVASPIRLDKRGPACTNGAVVFAVRGSDPNWNSLSTNPRYNILPPGMTAAGNAAINAAGGGSLNPIAYPAINPATGQYQQSVNMGIAALQDAIYGYIDACPNGKVVVLGFSQGGQVTSGALAGSTSRGPLKAHGRVTAGAIFADPTYQDGNFPLDAGSGANNGHDGTVPGDGTKYQNLNAWFGSRVRSYCQAGDKYCDSNFGVSSDAGLDIHTSSPQHFQDAASGFLASLM